jgi:hypothetical protein
MNCIGHTVSQNNYIYYDFNSYTAHKLWLWYKKKSSIHLFLTLRPERICRTWFAKKYFIDMLSWSVAEIYYRWQTPLGRGTLSIFGPTKLCYNWVKCMQPLPSLKILTFPPKIFARKCLTPPPPPPPLISNDPLSCINP